MNWLQNSTFAIIITSVALFSCKTGNEISGEVSPSEKLGAFYADTFSLPTSIVNFDSIATNGSYRVLVGKNFDPRLGAITANAYAQLWLNNSNLSSNFGPNPEVDSLYLNVFVGWGTARKTYVYGDTSTVYLKIYRLTSSINSDSTYYKSRKFEYESTPLAVLSVSSAMLNLTTNSIVKVTLPNSLGEEFITNQAYFTSTSTFLDVFKGLAIISDDANESIIGLYDLQLVMFYHNNYGLNNLPSQDFVVINGFFGAQYGANPYSAQNEFIVDRTGSQIELLPTVNNGIVSSTLIGNACYIQPNSGVFTKVSLSSLTAFKEKVLKENRGSKILITKAELVIHPELDTAVYKFPDRLYAFEMNEAGKVKRIADGSPQRLQDERGGNIFGAINTLFSLYDKSYYEYKFPLTTYVQAILDGSKANEGLLIGAGNEGNLYNTLNRVYFKNEGSLGGKKGIELKIYYTPYK